MMCLYSRHIYDISRLRVNVHIRVPLLGENTILHLVIFTGLLIIRYLRRNEHTFCLIFTHSIEILRVYIVTLPFSTSYYRFVPYLLIMPSNCGYTLGLYKIKGRSRWARGLRRWSAVAGLLEL